MKIAVLSDIHGNLCALKAIIDDINFQNIDRIFICGDLVMAGPEASETLDYIIDLKKQKDMVIIKGNTDEMIIKSTGSPDDGYTPPNETMAASLKYAQEILRADQKEFLYELPAQHKEKFGDLEVLFVHGSPRKNNEDIFPELPIEKVKELLGNAAEDVIFCGHTHMPVTYHVGRQIVVNVGSVGRPFTDVADACYAIMDYQSGSKVYINYRLVPYDYKAAAENLASLPFKGSDKLAKMLIKATSRYPE